MPAADAPSEFDLEQAGVRFVLGTTVNTAGMTLAKSVPLRRLSSFLDPGMGAARVWPVFCIDAGIAAAPGIDATGDYRLRLDADGLRDLGGGLAWSPAQLRTQSGADVAADGRGALVRVEAELRDLGLRALVGHELEFVLVDPAGAALPGGWVPYGATGLLDHEELVTDLLAAATHAGLDIQQVHSEYGPHQFELSLAPATPVAAADAVILAKLLVGRVARAHGLRASFSPSPFPGSVGNGAHQHFSLHEGDRALFCGGDGPHGLTVRGGHVIAGVLAGLADAQGLLAGSLLSAARMAPGMWAGAHIGWGLENRETAVRLIAGDTGSANVEVKCVDPSANVYVAGATVLALALAGIQEQRELPAEVTADPSGWTDADRSAAGVGLLAADQGEVLRRLDASTRLRDLLGADLVDASLAVRRHELGTYADHDPADVAACFRLAWSI